VYVENGKLTSSTGELAGSSLDMATAVRNTHHKLNISLGESLRMAGLYPAKSLYGDQKIERGELKIGLKADMVVLDDELCVLETWISGERI
jgi:N-acetylglucosamine-6-phosphate deacetylase